MHVQMPVAIGYHDMFWVIAEGFQPIKVISAKKWQTGQISELIIRECQLAHHLNLLTNFAGVFAQQFITTATKLSHDANIMIAMVDRLLHMKLVGVGI